MYDVTLPGRSVQVSGKKRNENCDFELERRKRVTMISSNFFLEVSHHIPAVKKTRGQSSSPTWRSIRSKTLTEVDFWTKFDFQ